MLLAMEAHVEGGIIIRLLVQKSKTYLSSMAHVR